MKLSCRVDGSGCGALLSTTRSAAVRRPASGQRSFGKRTITYETSPSSRQDKKAKGTFFCPHSSSWLLSTFSPTGEHRPRPQDSWTQRAVPTYSTAAAAAGSSKASSPVTAPRQDQDHLLSFVGQRPAADVDEYLRFHSDPYRRGYAQPDDPSLRVSEKKEDWQSPSGDELITLRDDHRPILEKLCAELRLQHRRPHKCSLRTIYETYKQLPEPRMLYIPYQWRYFLLKAMGTPQTRDVDSMMRYFALLADVKDAGLTIRLTQWNYALAFVQKSKNLITSQDSESALQVWMEMEQQAGVKANGVTFNILFDVASKTGNFALAEMIHKEMETRGVQPNRYNHVSLIHFFGLKLDTDGMIAAYQQMVQAGELVDTVVLNCLISGFLRSGDEGAAEQIYQRMMKGLPQAANMPERDYTAGKVITKVLMMYARIGKRHPSLRDNLQSSIPLTPDLQTYKLLIEHNAVRLGDLGKVTKYLDEMKMLDIPIHATIFLALLKGFFHHGGLPGSAWSKQRLDGVLSALYQARDQKVKDFRIRRWLVLWGMRAMKKCSKDNDEVEKTFNEMASRWDVLPEGQHFLEAVLEKILDGEDMMSWRGNWNGTWQKVKKDGSRL